MMNYLFSSLDVADVDRKVLRLIEFYKYYLIILVKCYHNILYYQVVIDCNFNQVVISSRIF